MDCYVHSWSCRNNKTAPESSIEDPSLGNKTQVQKEFPEVHIGVNGLEICDELFKNENRPFTFRTYSIYHSQVGKCII